MSTIWLRVMAMPGLQLPGQVGKLIEFSDIVYHVAESDGYVRATITRSGRYKYFSFFNLRKEIHKMDLVFLYPRYLFLHDGYDYLRF